MKQVPVKLGPLALLLTVISICLPTLSDLTLTTARADMRLAQKYADTITVRYALERQGQESLRGFTEGKTEGFEADEENIYRKVIEQDGSILRIGLELSDDGPQIVQWEQEHTWEQDTSIGGLWPGF